MAYRLNSGESIANGIRRVADEEIVEAASLLKGRTGITRDEAIHEARRSIKKIRALLRLMKPGFGAVYKFEDDSFRNAARELSKYRDTSVLIEVADDLAQKYKGKPESGSFEMLRRGLAKRQHELEQGGAVRRAMSRVAATLGKARPRVKEWPLSENGLQAVAPGLLETYRKGRKAMDVVDRRSDAQDCHRWRRRAKEFRYHIRLLDNLLKKSPKGIDKRLKNLDESLGDHHNLQLLRDLLVVEPQALSAKEDLDACLKALEKHQNKLRKKALSAGKRIYNERPKDFKKRIERLWNSY